MLHTTSVQRNFSANAWYSAGSRSWPAEEGSARPVGVGLLLPEALPKRLLEVETGLPGTVTSGLFAATALPVFEGVTEVVGPLLVVEGVDEAVNDFTVLEGVTGLLAPEDVRGLVELTGLLVPEVVTCVKLLLVLVSEEVTGLFVASTGDLFVFIAPIVSLLVSEVATGLEQPLVPEAVTGREGGLASEVSLMGRVTGLELKLTSDVNEPSARFRFVETSHKDEEGRFLRETVK